MPLTVTCQCGASYSIKEEFAGKVLQCPACRRTLQATLPVPMARCAQADPAFERDRFLLRQKVMTIASQKYFVWDEQNQPIIFVKRPGHPGRNLLAALGGIATFVALVAALVGLGVLLGLPEKLLAPIVVIGGGMASIAALAVGITLSAKRHVAFYRDESKREKLLEILQDKKFQPINVTYTLCDAAGNVLAHFHKNILYNFFRKRWYCYNPDMTLRCLAKEDSIILSLLRRFLGPMFGLLRTNFIILPADSELVIGEFNRKFTLFDRYVLDLTADPTRSLDRRIALALGVLLDTGERR